VTEIVEAMSKPDANGRIHVKRVGPRAFCHTPSPLPPPDMRRHHELY
jgi:hypothetical protein